MAPPARLTAVLDPQILPIAEVLHGYDCTYSMHWRDDVDDNFVRSSRC